MPTFKYKAKDYNGKFIQGAIEAENNAAVISQLQTMGYFPISIISEGKAKPFHLLGRRITTSDLTVFNRQLADLLDSGVPLVRGLDIIKEQTSNVYLKEIIESVMNDVHAGATLADALSKHPKVFSKLYCALVKSGEAGGMLETILQRLAEFSEKEDELKGKILSALAYPSVMVVVGISVVTILMTVVIPKIVDIFDQFDQTLPAITIILITVSRFTGKFWWAIIGSLLVLVVLSINFARTGEGKYFMDKLKLRIPLLGELVLKKEIGRFARTLGNLLKNGVSILPALDIVIESITNKVVERELIKMPEAISQGGNMSSFLSESNIFPKIAVSMIAVGERTGKVEEVLLKIASSYEAEVERKVKTITSLLEPIIILILGVVVGFIVIAMLLPIFSLNIS